MKRKPNGWHKARKESIASLNKVEKGVYQAHQHHRDVSHKRSHPNQPQEGQMQPHKQMALNTNKHKPIEGAKHGKI